MRKIFAIAVITLIGSTAFAAGEVYRWKDPNGSWHYSDQPRPGAELVRTGRIAPPPAAPTPPAPPATPAPSAPTDNSLPAVSPEVAQQVRQEATTARAQQCEKAKTDYDQSVRALRIYKTDEQGNRVFLSDAEIDAARLQARSVRDLACGS